VKRQWRGFACLPLRARRSWAPPFNREATLPVTGKTPSIAVVGACHLDRKARAGAPYVEGASNPVVVQACPGGVARNVAENLWRLGAEVALVTRLGSDAEGEGLLAGLAKLPIDLAGVTRSAAAPTAFHLIALQPDGEMLVAVADMRIYDEITPELLQTLPADLWTLDAVFADCNLPAGTLGFLAGLGRGRGCFAVNGVSPAKVVRLRACLAAVDLLFVNRREAAALLGQAAETLDPPAAAAELLAAGVGELVMTLGGEGICVAGKGETLVLPNLETRLRDVTGAGDALAAAFLEARLRGCGLAVAAARALAAARLTLETFDSVSAEMSPRALDALAS
jgi:pseudouridine kinase